MSATEPRAREWYDLVRNDSGDIVGTESIATEAAL
jgi:hypothetical protein